MLMHDGIAERRGLRADLLNMTVWTKTRWAGISAYILITMDERHHHEFTARLRETDIRPE